MGDLTPTRDFLYVKETVSGFIEIAKFDKTIVEEINIATQSEISIGNFAQKIIDQINQDAQVITDQQRVRPEKS